MKSRPSASSDSSDADSQSEQEIAPKGVAKKVVYASDSSEDSDDETETDSESDTGESSQGGAPSDDDSEDGDDSDDEKEVVQSDDEDDPEQEELIEGVTESLVDEDVDNDESEGSDDSGSDGDEELPNASDSDGNESDKQSEGEAEDPVKEASPSIDDDDEGEEDDEKGSSKKKRVFGKNDDDDMTGSLVKKKDKKKALNGKDELDEECDLLVDFDNSATICDKMSYVVVPQNERRTRPIMTKFETVAVIGVTHLHLEKMRKPYITNTAHLSYAQIAIEEIFGANRSPIVIYRLLPNKLVEKWYVTELKKIYEPNDPYYKNPYVVRDGRIEARRV